MSKVMSIRNAYGEALVDCGNENDKVVVVVADVSSSVKTDFFEKRFPERFFNVGISEQCLVNVGVGLSLEGFIPFVNTFAGLLLRSFEQIRTCVGYANTNVKLVGSYAGISDYKDGATHYSICDIAVMRSVPNVTVVVPADAVEVRKMVKEIAAFDGPVYFRISRADTTAVLDDSHQVAIGKGQIMNNGDDLTIIAAGVMVERSLRAAQQLNQDGIQARVINMSTIKPLDQSLVKDAAQETGAIVTAEEHSVIGGLGSAVSECISQNHPVPMEFVGIHDMFVETGLNPEYLLDHFGMSVEDIITAAKKVLKQKSK
jgi:transketolase